MKSLASFGVLGSICLSACLYAGESQEIQTTAPSTFISKMNPANAYIPLQIGWFWAHQGENQNIGINGLIGDRFTVTDHNDQNILIGLGYYIQGLHRDRVNLLYGLNAFYLAPTTVKGNVLQEQMFNNLSYKYDVVQYPLYVAIKALFPQNRYTITFDLGIGPNFIKTDHFSEQSLDGITLPDHIFDGTTTTAFSATVGIGFQFNNIFDQIPVECGYRFFYLGEGQLDKTNGQILNNLNTGNSYANAVVCSVAI